MIHFPTTPAGAIGATGPFRAGATDVEDRRRNGLLPGDLTDLRDLVLTDARAVTVDAKGGLSIGALCRVAELDVPSLAPWAGLREAARTLATPQIRAMATVGGSLLQANRCWYFRHPNLEAPCLKRGADTCAARTGDALRHALFDTGPCLSVHPSTLGCALLAYDGLISVQDVGGPRVFGSMLDLYGDGSDPTRDHRLPPRTLLVSVHLAHPGNELAVYARATGRVWAEWPLVEAVVRRTAEGVVFAVGGVGPVPTRLHVAEAEYDRGATIEQAVARECESRRLVEATRYKVQLLSGLLRSLLERVDMPDRSR